MRGLDASFAYFGGVPSELLFDQMNAVITGNKRDEGGRLIENPEFLRFSRRWRFRIRACRPYRAQTVTAEIGPLTVGHGDSDRPGLPALGGRFAPEGGAEPD